MTAPTFAADLDPGIRDLVAGLRAAGFNTTDSGDGVSKGDAGLPFPHVFIVSTPDRMLDDARAVRLWLAERPARVEASFDPSDESAIVAVYPETP